ncbi:hypothetical protein LEMLEM_LOCUS22065 [Lemmus lemmus]
MRVQGVRTRTASLQPGRRRPAPGRVGCGGRGGGRPRGEVRLEGQEGVERRGRGSGYQAAARGCGIRRGLAPAPCVPAGDAQLSVPAARGGAGACLGRGGAAVLLCMTKYLISSHDAVHYLILFSHLQGLIVLETALYHTAEIPEAVLSAPSCCRPSLAPPLPGPDVPTSPHFLVWQLNCLGPPSLGGLTSVTVSDTSCPFRTFNSAAYFLLLLLLPPVLLAPPLPPSHCVSSQ